MKILEMTRYLEKLYNELGNVDVYIQPPSAGYISPAQTVSNKPCGVDKHGKVVKLVIID